jgi:hypothetical protein
MLEATDRDARATESDGRSKWKSCKKQIKEIQETNDQVKGNKKIFEKRWTDVGEASERRGRRNSKKCKKQLRYMRKVTERSASSN